MSELKGPMLVFTMCGSEEEAGRVAARLVDSRLAACVGITARVRSVYRWKGQIEDAEEWALTIKTRGELYARVEAAIREAHSYEVPEILAVPVAAGWPAYLEWLEAETAEVAGGAGDVIR
jgi:periplasmic divalent cation tolerance protein